MEGGSKLYPHCLRPWIPLCMKPERATLRLRGQYIPPSGFTLTSVGILSIWKVPTNTYIKYHLDGKWCLSLRYFLIFQRGSGRLWDGLTTQSPLLWLKHAITGPSHDEYKWSRRKLSASSLAFNLDFNTLIGNFAKAVRWCCAQNHILI